MKKTMRVLKSSQVGECPPRWSLGGGGLPTVALAKVGSLT
jgi:hypothetical protein